MRQLILRAICDGCGRIAQYVTVSSEPLLGTLYPGDMLARRGWQSRPQEGSQFSSSKFATYDLCPLCVEKK